MESKMDGVQDYYELYPYSSERNRLLIREYLRDVKIAALLQQLKEHSPDAYWHSIRVFDTALKLCNCNDNETERFVGMAALLHDVGKILVPSEILSKPGRLTSEERRVMQRHPADGVTLLEKQGSLLSPLVRRGILEHHERADGTGYPYGIKEGELWKPGIGIAVADVFDALTHDRPYKQKIDTIAAVAIVRYEFFSKDGGSVSL